MQLKHIFVILSLGFLSSCATMNNMDGSTEENSIAQLPDQQKLISAFNTAKDGSTKDWTSDDNETNYQLLTSNTHVNYQGVPCREFNLVVSRSFYRSQNFSGVACRYKNQWKDLKSAQQAYGGE